jgi:tripartite-type tricarboxylate transporter receptor subunit TctC
MLRTIVQGTLLAAAMSLTLLVPSVASAETYPGRPITLIVTFPPGGSADIVARTLEPIVSADLGQALVIDNRPGAGGNVGIGAVARAAPDGYTLGIAAAGVLAVNPHIKQSMPFDPIKDLAPVTMVAKTPFVLAAFPGGPAKSIADVIAVAKAKPEAMSIGHGGNGTAMHLTAALFIQRAQVTIPLVAYRGTAPAARDVLGGHVALAVLDLPTSQQLIDDGKLLALAVTSAKRMATLPNVPTMIESGIEGYESVGWFGLVAPAGTPAAVVARLNGAFGKALQAKTVVDKLAALGTESVPGTPDEFGAYIRSENEKWGKVVAAAGVKE